MSVSPSIHRKAVITIAKSKKAYVEMACNLAMSFLLWNDITDISFSLITDCPGLIPARLKEKINVVNISPADLGEGFSSKLSMYEFSKAKQTLFIDADCLVYGSLMPAFDAFRGNHVSAIGYNRYSGKNIGFCKDIEDVLQHEGIKYFPLICGSVYYFEKSELAQNIFRYANGQLKNYFEIGLVPLRGKENEEPLIAIAMAKFNQEPVVDTGLIKADRMFYEFLEANVIEGKAKLWNNKKVPVPEYSSLRLALPLIVHFNGHYAESYEYQSEAIRLKKVFIEKKTVNTANVYAHIVSLMPGKIKKSIKDYFRPHYTRVFGHRKIKTLKRI